MLINPDKIRPRPVKCTSVGCALLLLISSENPRLDASGAMHRDLISSGAVRGDLVSIRCDLLCGRIFSKIHYLQSDLLALTAHWPEKLGGIGRTSALLQLLGCPEFCGGF